MEKIYLHPDIFYIENFLTPEEIEIFDSQAREDDWAQESTKFDINLKYNWENKIKKVKDIDLFERIRQRVIDHFPEDKKHLHMTQNRAMKRYMTNESDNKNSQDKYVLVPHHDAQKDPWQLGMIIYINDDYEGGEISYPNLGIEFKPKKGTLLMHGVTEDCIHAVKKVTKGERYVFTFFAGDPNEELLKDKDLGGKGSTKGQPLYRIRNVFEESTYNHLVKIAKNQEGYDLTGYDPEGFWDNRMKKIHGPEFREVLTEQLKSKINSENIIINEVTMVKVIDENCISDDNINAIPIHKIKFGPKNWNFLCVIAINDDYEGGEMIFPVFDNMKFKQEKNSAVCIDGETEWGMSKVLSGKKYILTIYGEAR